MRRTRLAEVIVVVAGLLAAACGQGGGGGSTIVLGSSLSLTGPLGAFGVLQQKGYQQAVADLNAAGGVDVGGNREKVSLTILDNRSDPTLASQQARTLALKDNVTALLGPSTPPITIPEALVADQERVPMVATNTPILAFQQGNSSGWKYTWDFFFDERDQATTSFQAFNLEPSNKRVALFTDSEPDGVVERGFYKDAAAANGYAVVGDYTFPVGTTDFSVFVNDAKAKGAEVLLAQVIPPDGIALWKQMKALGYAPKMALAAKAGVTGAWWQGLGPIAEGTLSEGVWSPNEGYPGTAHMEATLGRQLSLFDLQFAVCSYTAVQIVADAVTRAGSTGAAALNAAIGKTNKRYPFAGVKFGAAHTSATPHLITQWVAGKTVQIIPQAGGTTPEFPAAGLKAG
jgi:branched-chain amino acid transport system substrate-binding protein